MDTTKRIEDKSDRPTIPCPPPQPPSAAELHQELRDVELRMASLQRRKGSIERMLAVTT